MNLDAFFEEQMAVYPLAADNFRKLEDVRTKVIGFDGFDIYIHFNPARAVSTLAKLDKKSIAERPCFLCSKNWPKEQGALDFKGKYSISVNPYPICTRHFTVISKKHELQQLSDEKIDDFYDLAYEAKGWVVLYNGATSGASAPDHFHFQIGNDGYFKQPVETEMKGLIEKIVFKERDKAKAVSHLREVIAGLGDGKSEPALNLFCQYKEGGFVTTVFPRICHRPKQFFATDDSRLQVSPGAIDMTGNIIVAREEDFNKITKDLLIDIFHQVSGKLLTVNY